MRKTAMMAAIPDTAALIEEKPVHRSQGLSPDWLWEAEGGIAALDAGSEALLEPAGRVALRARERGDEIDAVLGRIRDVRTGTPAV